MTQLQPAELLRDDKMWTRDVFLSKYKSTDPKNKFSLQNKTKVKLVSDKDQLIKLTNALKGTGNSTVLKNMIFTDTEGIEYKGTGRFLKTVEFGSSGGRAGTKDTKVNECAQCVYNVALLLNPTGYDYKFKEENLHEAFKSTHCVIDERAYSKIRDLAEEWKTSSEVGAEALQKNINTKIYFGSGYQHHRGSNVLVKKISKKYKEINGELSPKQFGQEDKWSPADIWMVKEDYISEFVVELEKTTNFKQLNSLLEQGIAKKILIGVSLKQLSGRVNFAWKNYRAGGWKPKTYKFKSFDLGKGEFMKSMYGNIEYTGGRIAFRTMVGVGGFSGEIAGERAQLGKVSGQLGPNSVVGISTKKYFGKATTAGRDVLQRYQNDYKNLAFEFFENYKKTGHTEFKDGEHKVFFDKVTKKAKESLPWFVSKFMATEIMALLNTAPDRDNNRQKDGFITALLTYAASESENSAPHLVIS